MKPIYIEMKAFGCYREERIDFSRMQNGIFLVTGDTGSGKTTIFDAITYALYGETSGGKRSGKMMCSQYAVAGSRTEVTFCFLYRGQKYTIVRSPEQPKWKKVTDETGEHYRELKTSAAPVVELTLPDGTVFAGKVKETNQRIEELIGLNAMQFTQVAMLAQGEFIRLLHASSEERREIFSKIFDTRIYELIQCRLAEESKELAGQLEKNRQDIIWELGKIRCAEGSKLQEAWEVYETPFVEAKPEELLNLVADICDEGQQIAEEVMRKRADNDREIKSNVLQMEKAEAVNELFAQKRVCEEKSRLLNERAEEIAKKRERVALGVKAARIDKIAHRLADRKKEFALSSARMEELKRWKEENQERRDALQIALNEAAEQKEKKEPLLTREIACISDSLGNYAKIKEAEEKLAEKSGEAEQLAGQRKQAAEQIRQLEEEERKVYQKYFGSQVELLRLELVDNMPCPVCGNIFHAKGQNVHVSVSDMGKGEIASVGAVGEMGGLEKKLSSLAKQREKWRKQEEEAEQRQFANKEETVLLQADLEHLKQSAAFEDEETARKELLEKQKERDAIVGKWEKLDSESRNLEQLWTQKMTEISVEEKHFDSRRRELDEVCGQYRQSLHEQGFSNETLYLQASMKEEEMEELRQEIDDYTVEQKLLEGRLEELRRQTEGKAELDLTEYQQKEKELEETKHSLERQANMLFQIAEANQEAFRAGKRLYKEREKVKKRAAMLSLLDKTANGNLSQRQRINLQTYVQRRYFKQMVRMANERLKKMSGSFRLRCRDIKASGMQGKIGMELDVYSIVNDNVRDVRTLSGGESFMAAMAMALGMADMIQNNRGSVQIETMFIDEGFGSLSDEARNQAVAMLNELSDGSRLVGIISHVSELKNQIETQLVVTKNAKGSRAEWKL